MKINYKLPIIDFKKGSVVLAGGGPGSIELITLKVYQAIKQADVIIYDALVNKDLLKISKNSSKHIYGGKTKKKKACSQEEINEWMILYAKRNKKVLRLKGGDLSFFSRGSQEIECLKKNKVEFKIYSGITSSQAALKCFELSFFNKNNVCNFITGHRKINEKSVSKDLKKILKNQGRIIIYMGVGQIKEISTELIDLGMNKNTKVFIVSNASHSSESFFKSKISKVSEMMIKNCISPPSIIIIN
tara:strand:- start:1007 stop:1741 length:735 start_codon:yes stop_codon:yes gene_type:complete